MSSLSERNKKGDKKMKVWYSKKWDMYYPLNDKPEDEPDDLVEIEVTKEEIICDGGSDKPYLHAGRWEQGFYDDSVMHSMMTKIPWKEGKYRIVIEEVDGEND